MKHKNIPFSPPDMSEDEINEVADTLRNGMDYNRSKSKRI